jgi:hypothetical protein
MNFSYSQQIFKNYGERETVEILDIELLKLVSKKSEFIFDNIYLDKSFSKKYAENITFYSIRYITKKLETENYYTTKFLFVNENGEILGELNNKNLSYSDNEAGQPNPTKILKNNISINKNINGIGIITTFSSPSRIFLYSEELLSVIILENNSPKIIIENYPIRKTQGESNGWGNYEIEVSESLIFVEKEKSYNFNDLKIMRNYTFEKYIEKDSLKSIKEFHKKDKIKEIEIIKYNGEKYTFKKNEYKFLKGY